MSTTWKVACKDCGGPVNYSDSTREAAVERGQAAPERCAECRSRHRRETSRLGLAYVELEPGRPIGPQGVKAGRLGRIERAERPHTATTREPEPIADDEFGIKDEHVVELLGMLTTHQVAIVQAGTGSGKSTFLPWRLLICPPPYESDHLTRHGQILVTQPRIDASTGIPEYVARRLHASNTGPGLDIGYRNSKATDKSDGANKLIYLTDGTLVNMIRKGELHTISTIVIDEAHERSLNIDLILALLRREMRNYPQLRLLIVSATLEQKTFTDFFAPDYDVAFCPMPSKGTQPVHERWRASEGIPTTSWPAKMPDEVAQVAHEVLRWMELGERPADIPDSVPGHDGDILCFLPGKRPIAQAIEKLRELIDDDEDLRKIADRVELLPLHSELPTKQRRKPLDPNTRGAHVKYRVIVSTNLAETSLTIDGIRHVIDSGLNNLKTWDPTTGAEDMRPAPHSKAGLLQRRGRAGRNAPGVWHCLFTKEQFDALNYETAPEIARAPLSAVLLNAAVAGVTDPEEHCAGPRRVRARPSSPGSRAEMLAIGAVTADGDPTEYGREVNASRGEFSDTTLLINADLAGCVVEAATVLAMKARSLDTGSLLRWSRYWPAEAKLHVDDVHSTLLAGCPDDLEAICRIISYWEQAGDVDARRAWCDRHYIDTAVIAGILHERAELLGGLQSRMKSEQLRELDLRLLPRLRAVVAWTYPNGIYAVERDDDGLKLSAHLSARSDAEVVETMNSGATPVIDARSWAHRQAPPFLVLLDRSRATQWSSPLRAPRTVQQGALCAAVDPDVLDGISSLHALLTKAELGEAPAPPVFLPGDRVQVRRVGEQVEAVRMLPGIPDPTVELGGDDDDDGTVDDHTGEHSQITGGEEEDELTYISPWEESAARPAAGPSAGSIAASAAANRQAADRAGGTSGRGGAAARGGRGRGRTRGPGFDEVVRRGRPQTDELPTLEIVDYAGQGTADADEVTLLAVFGSHAFASSADDAARSAAFVDAHPAGSTLTARIEEVRTFPRDRRPGDRRRRRSNRASGRARRQHARHRAAFHPGRAAQRRLHAHTRRRRLRPPARRALPQPDGGDDRGAVRVESSDRAGAASMRFNATLVDAAEGKLWAQVVPDGTFQARRRPSADRARNRRGSAASDEWARRGAAQVRLKLSWKRRTSSTQRVSGLDASTRDCRTGRGSPATTLSSSPTCRACGTGSGSCAGATRSSPTLQNSPRDCVPLSPGRCEDCSARARK